MTNTAQQSEKDNKYSQRTQISLSPKLRREIEKRRMMNDESLSEYIRNAVNKRINSDEMSNIQKMKSVKDFVGARKETRNPNWNSDKNVINWQRMLRKDKES